ncbi:MAG: MFS transporter [Verrucomicrobiales bacterium]
MNGSTDKKLFWACLIALVATSFVFGVRSTLIGSLGREFDLSQTEIGQILGVGLWPFAISIIVFSLIIDKIGYKTAAIFAIVCHVVAIVWTLRADGYRDLFWSTFIVAIANGTVEAFINPVVATIFNKEKAKWLNILHAGWPLGLALGALFTILLGYFDVGWRVQFAMCFLPVLVYAILVVPLRFPQQERVAAGVTYREMLQEVGGVGFLIISWLFVMGINQMLGFSPAWWVPVLVAMGIAGVVGFYTRSAGNWMFLLVLVTMGPLATTELGTDTWMQQLLEGDLGPRLAGWIFILISVIMTVLRFYAGPIVHKFSPIGLLVLSAFFAVVGLLFLWKAMGMALVAAAILYAFGKTFLWSTTLGFVSEQFPKGGALTLNGVSAVGVLGMGIIGTPLMGYFLDRGIDDNLRAEQPGIHQRVTGPDKATMFGDLPSINNAVVEELNPGERASFDGVVRRNKKLAFARQATLPAFLLVCYLILFFYFRAKGGYRPEELPTKDRRPGTAGGGSE